MDFLIKDNCDTAALNMENSQDRKSKTGAKEAAQEEKSCRKTKTGKVGKRDKAGKKRKIKIQTGGSGGLQVGKLRKHLQKEKR